MEEKSERKKVTKRLESETASPGFSVFRFLESLFHILSVVITAICLILIITSGLVLWILMYFFS